MGEDKMGRKWSGRPPLDVSRIRMWFDYPKYEHEEVIRLCDAYEAQASIVERIGSIAREYGCADNLEHDATVLLLVCAHENEADYKASIAALTAERDALRARIDCGWCDSMPTSERCGDCWSCYGADNERLRERVEGLEADRASLLGWCEAENAATEDGDSVAECIERGDHVRGGGEA